MTTLTGEQLAASLEAYAKRVEPAARDAFLQAVAAATKSPTFEAIIADIRSGRITYDQAVPMMDALDVDLGRFKDILKRALIYSGKASGAGITAAATLEGAFAVANPVVLAQLRSIDLSTTVLYSTTVAGAKAIILDAIDKGLAPAVLVSRLKDHLGLIPAHVEAVERMRAQLTAAGVPNANAILDDYVGRLKLWRAKTIATTEVMNAVRKGQQAMWEQAKADGLLPFSPMKRWIISQDELTCSICRRMEGVEVPVSEEWMLPDGTKTTIPIGHPTCRCTSGLVFPTLFDNTPTIRKAFTPSYGPDVAQVMRSGLDLNDKLMLLRLVKHYGPGPHDNGSEQSVHGSGGGGTTTLDPERFDFSLRRTYGRNGAEIKTFLAKHGFVSLEVVRFQDNYGESMVDDKMTSKEHADIVNAAVNQLAELGEQFPKAAESLDRLVFTSRAKYLGAAQAMEVNGGLWPNETVLFIDIDNLGSLGYVGPDDKVSAIIQSGNTGIQGAYTSIHEFGHLVHFNALRRLTDDRMTIASGEAGAGKFHPGLPGGISARDVYKRMNDEPFSRAWPSVYSKKDPAEMFAEGFLADYIRDRPGFEDHKVTSHVQITQLVRDMTDLGERRIGRPEYIKRRGEAFDWRGYFDPTDWDEINKGFDPEYGLTDGDDYARDSIMGQRFRVQKHYGPGPHANGTPQDIHGGDGGPQGTGVNPNTRTLTSMASPSQAAMLRRLAIDQGGFTWDDNGKRTILTGKALSMAKENEEVFSLDDWKKNGRAILRDYMRRHEKALRPADTHIGAWVDDGQVYLDISIVKQSHAEAAKASRAHDQLAYFDLDTFTTYYRQPDGKYIGEVSKAAVMGMICVRPQRPEAHARTWEGVPGALPPEELHLTLAYLGERTFSAAETRKISRILEECEVGDFDLEIIGIAHYGDGSDPKGIAVVYELGGESIHKLRDRIVRKLDAEGIEFSKKWPDFKPHMTLAWMPREEAERRFPVTSLSGTTIRFSEPEAKIGEEYLSKHYEGQHDQRTHGSWARGMTPQQKEQVLATADSQGITPEQAKQQLAGGGNVGAISVTQPGRSKPNIESGKFDPTAIAPSTLADAMERDPKWAEKVLQRLQDGDVAGFEHVESLEEAVQLAQANIEWAWKESGLDADLKGLEDWYQRANDFNTAVAAELGVHPDVMTAITARLSPGQAWGNNIAMSQFLAETLAEDPEITQEMIDAAILEATDDEGNIKTYHRGALKGEPVFDAESIEVGQKLSEVDSANAGWLIRGQSKIKGVTQLDGQKIGWTNGGDLSKAVEMWRAGQTLTGAELTSRVSLLMGDGEKIRSFYNNMRDPANMEHVTVDTHATGIALGVPVAMSSWEIGGAGKILQTPSSVKAGSSGTYQVWAEAYRRVGQKHGITPSDAQAITWQLWNEGVAGQEGLWPERARERWAVNTIRGIRREIGFSPEANALTLKIRNLTPYSPGGVSTTYDGTGKSKTMNVSSIVTRLRNNGADDDVIGYVERWAASEDGRLEGDR